MPNKGGGDYPVL